MIAYSDQVFNNRKGVILSERSPIWISHRGLCQGTVENSKNSFSNATKVGFHWLETDLRISSDNVLFLFHDHSLSRLVGVDRLVTDMTWAELTQLRLVDGQPILSFSEFMELFPQENWIFDIKPEHGERTVKALIKWIESKSAEHFILQNAWFLFWNTNQRRMLLQKYPSARVLAGQAECYRAGIAVLFRVPWLGGIKPGHVYSINPRFLGFSLFKKRIVGAYINRGAKVLAYLPETEKEVSTASRLPFYMILTNGMRV